MLDEALDLLDIQADGVYADLTFGGGGHSRGILERLGVHGRLYGLDQDAEARRNVPDDARFTFVEGNFRFMRGLLRSAVAGREESKFNSPSPCKGEVSSAKPQPAAPTWRAEPTAIPSEPAAGNQPYVTSTPQPPSGVPNELFQSSGENGRLAAAGENFLDGVLADLGVSSHHFDVADRGFSFRGEGPLDMRMNRSGRLTAAEVVNTYEPARLIAVFRDYGELPDAHKIAGRVVEARRGGYIGTTADLLEIVRPLVPRRDENRYLSQLFQALRIEVNGEMEALRMALEQSLKALRPGGRLVVISYHSLEDRLVKNFLKSGNFEGRVEKDFYGRPVTPWEVVTRKALVPGAGEVERNPRSRSAKLRAAAKR